jgi:Tol biopolymer transport system component
LYLSNGDILLSGARQYNPENPWPSREIIAELWVLKKDLSEPPIPLGQYCFEGPALSRKNMKIAWTVHHDNYPDRIPEKAWQIWTGEIICDNGKPKLVNKQKILDNKYFSFFCELEVQNFIPPDEKALTFSIYVNSVAEVMSLDMETGKVINHTNSPEGYDEPEGVFPDGKFTLVESDKHNLKGPEYIDIYKLALDGSGAMERLTYFADYPGYQATNPVISDDGRYMAFQIAKKGDAAGVGRGIFLFDFSIYKKTGKSIHSIL